MQTYFKERDYTSAQEDLISAFKPKQDDKKHLAKVEKSHAKTFRVPRDKVAQSIKDYCKANKIGHHAFARMMKVTYQTVWRWVNQRANISQPYYRLLRIYGVIIEDLIPSSSQEKSPK